MPAPPVPAVLELWSARRKLLLYNTLEFSSGFLSAMQGYCRSAMLIVFLHGWGVETPDYGALPIWLKSRAPGTTTLDVRLSKYISSADHVTMDDLARAFERVRLLSFPGRPFACITHSTGGPLMRTWLAQYGAASGNALTHLVMLAPPNHGSALAQLGKGRVSRMKFWLEGREPGERVLDWLELGSEESWELNRAWIEQCPAERPFVFSVIGGTVDHKLYDLLNTYTGEKGSDGVVRSASANLNYNLLRLQQRGDELEMVSHQASPETAFGILPGLSHCGRHMGILNSITTANADQHPAAIWVGRALGVNNRQEYAALSQSLAGASSGCTAPCAMLIFRLKDQQGMPVTDFDLYLTSGPEYQPDQLPKGFFIDRQRNQKSPEFLTYFLDYSALSLAKELGFLVVPRPNRGPARLSACEFRSCAASVERILRVHQTVMVDIVLERTLEPDVLSFI